MSFVISAASQQRFGVWDWNMEFWTVQKTTLTSKQLNTNVVICLIYCTDNIVYIGVYIWVNWMHAITIVQVH